MLNIAELKLGHSRVFVFPIGGYEIPTRPLSFREFETYGQVINLPTLHKDPLYNSLFKDIVLDPLIIDQMMLLPAGVVPSICEASILISGVTLREDQDFNLFNARLQGARNSVQKDPVLQMCGFICTIFPGYKISDLRELDFQTILEIAAIAEIYGADGEPVLNIKPMAKQKSIVDQMADDARKMQSMDHIPRAPGQRPQMPISGRPEQQMTPKQIRDIQTLQRIKDQRASENRR